MIKEFTIDRKIWLRGEGGGAALLRVTDNKQCCLGIYLEKCGVIREKLANFADPIQVESLLPAEARWLIEPGNDPKHNSIPAFTLMEANDDEDCSERTRETRVTHLFARQGITVTFTGDKEKP